MMTWACVAVGLSLAGLASENNQEYPTCQVARVTHGPVVDGVLNDDVWRSVQPIAGFVTNRDHKPTQYTTEFRLVYDSEALYAAIVAHEPDLGGLKTGKENVWQDDCVEIFLDPHATRARFFQYIINSAGEMESGYVGDFAADIPGQAVAGRVEEGWTVEVRMPFEGFGAEPHLGERWGLNLTRGREPKAEGEKRENSLWSPTDGQHGSPGRFGYLVFASVAGNASPRETPEMQVTDRILDRVRSELYGQWRWSDADVSFEARSRRARELVSLIGTMARFPETRLLYSVRPPIRDEHVLPWSVPAINQLGGQVELTACRGEFEPVSLQLFAVRDIQDVRVEWSDLVCDSGGKLPAAVADLYHVQCWYQSGVGTIHPGATTLLAELLVKDPNLVSVDPVKRTNVLHFDVIPTDARRLKPMTIPAFESRQIWITCRIPADAIPGRYRGTVTIRDREGICASVPVNLRVPAWELLKSPLLHGLYYGRRMPKVSSIEEEHAFFEVYEQELRDQIEHGCNVVATYVHTGPLPSDRSPCATAQRISDIQKKYGVTGTPYFGVVDHVGFQQGEEQLAAVTKRARQLDRWARANGRNGFCFQGRDEASGERLREQRSSWQAARRGGGKMWVACGSGYFEHIGDILDYPVVAGRLRPELAEKVHANGFRILSYGNPQVGVERPEVYRRNYGLRLLVAGYDGAMNYEYRTMDDTKSWDDFDHGHYRDHNFAYPAVNKPIDTIQFEGWREGIDDIRYAVTLKQVIDTAIQSGRQVEYADESQHWLAGLRGDEDLDSVRTEMIRRIDRLTQGEN